MSEDINEAPPVLEWDFWDEVGLHCAGYSAQIDADLFKVFLGVRAGMYLTEIAKHFDLPESYVELLQYALCSIGWCDYGTSPRGCFVGADQNADALQEKLLKWFIANWSDEEAHELREAAKRIPPAANDRRPKS